MSEMNHQSEGERLAKRVAALQGCSRAEAERLIEGGWVKVDGLTADDPARRVRDEAIEIDASGLGETLLPVTLLWHRPVGVALVEGQPLAGLVSRGPVAALAYQAPALRQPGCRPPAADWPCSHRALACNASCMRMRCCWNTNGCWTWRSGKPDARLEALEQDVDQFGAGAAQAYLKLSVGSRSAERTRLRLALKGYLPERLPQWLAQTGLEPHALQRLRLGRVALGQVAKGLAPARDARALLENRTEVPNRSPGRHDGKSQAQGPGSGISREVCRYAGFCASKPLAKPPM